MTVPVRPLLLAAVAVRATVLLVALGSVAAGMLLGRRRIASASGVPVILATRCRRDRRERGGYDERGQNRTSSMRTHAIHAQASLLSNHDPASYMTSG